MTVITIPDEAVEATIKADAIGGPKGMERAIRAALKAWPNAVFATEANTAPCIYLPLPLEKTNGH